MSMKEVKVKEAKKDKATIDNLTVRVRKGYSFTIKKGKDGTVLDKPIVKYNAVDSYFVDEDGKTYYEIKRDGEVSYRECEIIDVVSFTTEKEDGTSYTRTNTLPESLATFDALTIALIKKL